MSLLPSMVQETGNAALCSILICKLHKLWRFFMAPLRCISAAGREQTAFRRVQGTGNLALKDDLILFCMNIRDRDRGEESSCIGVEWISIELLFVCKLHDPSQIHDSYPVAQIFYHTQIV